MPAEVADIASRFAVTGKLIAADPFTGGHINDSHLLTYRRAGGAVRFLLQRINDAVFPKPALVMDNIQRVTAHIADRLKAQGVADIHRRVLTLVLTREGGAYHRDAVGGHWRLYHFIEGTRVYEAVETPRQAEFAGRAFGAFQCLLADFAGPRLHETIPDFHNTPLRCEALDRAVQTDSYNRVSAARAEIDTADRYRPLAGVLLDLHGAGEIPERIAHNDAKISNVLFDRTTGAALCVTDLDTVMPGLALNDFGDMVRSMTCAAAEDETDLSKVEVQMPLFEALARGYLEAAGEFLTPAEREHLVLAGKLITLEQGVRFLTDFLTGDTYYKTQRPKHNLDRCRTQFRLVESIDRHEALMNRFVGSL
ncbi:MAG TPA: aminoglycoside phosphotransferase family protein [Phycisphaerae bacterium]|nr:aminoglycoside phosphotransferase family protein [Phycisphaerae bacterium]